jgi:uncharacterized membrane protein
MKKETVNQETEVTKETKESKKEKTILNFFITTLNGMAYGLFATLIIGTIIYTLGGLFPHGEEANGFCNFMYNALTKGALCLEYLTGAGIGVGVAITLKKNPLQTIVLAGVGELAAILSLSTKFVTNFDTYTFPEANGAIHFQIGDPLTIYLVVISVALLMKLVLRKKTPVDILIVPLFSIAVGLTASLLIRFPAIYVTYGMQWLVNSGTNAVPFVMGVVVAVLMGMALTAPISSAAIAAMVFTLPAGLTITEALANSEYSGLVIASGAACVGCCCQMLGFAVMSRKDNPIGMVISIGIGTSMLQFKNILKKPLIWLPPIIVSAILGPVSTCWLRLICMGSSAGMGTSGVVGLIGLYSSMGNNWQTWVGMFGLCVAAPIALTFGIDLLFRKLGWIKKGDLSLSSDL